MKGSKLITVGLIVMALVAMLVVAAACATQPKTLQDYFDQNKAEWAKVQEALEGQGGDILDVKVEISGDEITTIMTYKQTFPAEGLPVIAQALEGQRDMLTAQLQSQIAQIGDATGFEGITWVVEYRNGDGATIWSMTVG